MILHPFLLKGSRIREEQFGGILMAPIASALKTGQAFYLLTEVDFLILQSCNGLNTIEMIAQIIEDNFNVEIQRVTEDLRAYLTEMIEIGILGNKE